MGLASVQAGSAGAGLLDQLPAGADAKARRNRLYRGLLRRSGHTRFRNTVRLGIELDQLQLAYGLGTYGGCGVHCGHAASWASFSSTNHARMVELPIVAFGLIRSLRRLGRGSIAGGSSDPRWHEVCGLGLQAHPSASNPCGLTCSYISNP
jgi:hypothetical protein